MIKNDKAIEVKYINYLTRGRRYVFLIPEDEDRSKIFKIIEWCSGIWNGHETIIVPYNNDGIAAVFVKMLKQFDPDHIFKIGEVNSVVEKTINVVCSAFTSYDETIEEFLFESRNYPHVPIENVLKYNPDVNSIYKLINITHDNDSLLVASKIGILPGVVSDYLTRDRDSESIEAQNKHIIVKEFEPKNFYRELNSFFDTREKYQRLKFKDLCPFDLCEIGYEKYYYKEMSFAKSRYVPPVFIIGETQNDYCLYYNLSRFMNYVYWIPNMIYFDTYRKYLMNHIEHIYMYARFHCNNSC